MGVLDWLFGRRRRREQEMQAGIPPVRPTPGTRTFEMPQPTPTTRPLRSPGTTAGTRSWRQPGGTPSTQRIHNPPRPGR